MFFCLRSDSSCTQFYPCSPSRGSSGRLNLGLIIASFFKKALRYLFYALVFLGGNPFRVIRRGPLIYQTLKPILITVLVLTPVT